MSKYRDMSLMQLDEKMQPEEKATDEQLVQEMKLFVNQRAIKRLSRRNFLASAGLAVGATGAIALAGCGSSSSTTTTVAPVTTTATPVAAVNEIDVLNFALNLEYLEATYYSYVTTGAGLPSSLTGSSPGTVTGGAQITFSDPNVTALAQQLASDEMTHVMFIQSLITAAGQTPVPLPALNLAALTFPTNDATFLAQARQLETVGTSAYEGGISYFVSDLVGLTYAATIHDAEGQHEAALRQFCIAKNITSAAVDSQDVAVSGSTGPAFSTSSSTGLNALRTPSQVLQIVYAAPGQTGVTSGGFYPSGMTYSNIALATT